MDHVSTRGVVAVHSSIRDDIGDLVTRRPLPGRSVDQVDPFLFLNHHGPQVYPPGNRGLPFGPHPHRGFETVTFILQGSLAHRDTGGHESVIHEGGVQWMTAGRGLEHAEVSPEEFLEQGGPLEILQLWVNLPARLKMTDPQYVGLQRDAIPAVQPGSGVTVHLISGAWDEQTGPIESLTGVMMSVVELQEKARVALPAPAARNVFLYVVRGDVLVSGAHAASFHLVELDHSSDGVEVEASTDAVLLFGHAEPIGEPVVAHGPFVMNTTEEIYAAIQDYQEGKFRGTRAI